MCKRSPSPFFIEERTQGSSVVYHLHCKSEGIIISVGNQSDLYNCNFLPGLHKNLRFFTNSKIQPRSFFLISLG